MKVTKGLSTYAGLLTALAQYLGAVALFLEADDQALALGPLATATLTLYKVLDGRFGQAVAALENPKPTQAPLVPSVQSDAGTMTATTWAGTRPGAHMTYAPDQVQPLSASAFFSEARGSDDEPGDEDALPEYETTEDPPPDEGDKYARPEATP